MQIKVSHSGKTLKRTLLFGGNQEREKKPPPCKQQKCYDKLFNHTS